MFCLRYAPKDPAHHTEAKRAESSPWHWYSPAARSVVGVRARIARLGRRPETKETSIAAVDCPSRFATQLRAHNGSPI